MSTLMTPDIEKYYDSYADLFMTNGWKVFQEDIQAAIISINIMSMEDAKDLHIAQGKLDVFYRLINWQASIEAAYQELLEQQKQDGGSQ
tara:strand:- start:34 stop:300 length:267 start_codon:yes stop_codon:yes gene_type:complete